MSDNLCRRCHKRRMQPLHYLCRECYDQDDGEPKDAGEEILCLERERDAYKAQRDRLVEALERIMNIKPNDRNTDADYWSFQFGRCEGIAKSALAAVKGADQ